MLSKPGSQKSVLLIDDDQSVSQMLSMLLETRGYKVSVAYSGEEALAKVSSSLDLILLDLVLPDKEGLEICHKIKEDKATHHIPIIVLSAKLLSEDIVEALYLGADDYLTKPFDYEELVARMEAVMRRGSIFKKKDFSQNSEESIVRELRKIIDQELVTPFYQPIYQFKPFKLLGLEALCRPKTQSLLANPEMIFKAAIQFGFYHELELLSWKKALENASRFLDGEKLFLNCNPYLVEGPKFVAIKSMFDQSSVQIQNVVLEITERSAVIDFKGFYSHLKRFRDCGFQFAVDDVGGGYASLESIVETKPEVVKIDRHIVNGVADDPYKTSIVKFVVAFCQENNILCIAEGIESKADLKKLMELGVDAGQGYYLYKPTPDINIRVMDGATASFL